MKNISKSVFLLAKEIDNLFQNDEFKLGGEIQSASYKLFCYAYFEGIIQYSNPTSSTNHDLFVVGYEEILFSSSIFLGNQLTFEK